MNPEERVAFINAQVACALIDLAGMQAENRQREMEGKSLAYTEDAFQVMKRGYCIDHNAVVSYLSGR